MILIKSTILVLISSMSRNIESNIHLRTNPRKTIQYELKAFTDTYRCGKVLIQYNKYDI